MDLSLRLAEQLVELKKRTIEIKFIDPDGEVARRIGMLLVVEYEEKQKDCCFLEVKTDVAKNDINAWRTPSSVAFL